MGLSLESEAEFQRAVIQYARLRGWRVAHFLPGMNARGRWRTAVQGDGAGFPDLVLCRDRVVFVELKASSGRLKADQAEWAARLRAAGAEWHLWKPADWPAIERTLA